MSLGLSMIVKNAAKTLRRALDPLAGAVDEIVAVDTGSTDETVEILNSYGALIIHDEWRDDFSRARNVALDNSGTDWFFSLDADEWLSPEDARGLRKLTTGSVDAWVIETMNFVTTQSADTLPTSTEDRAIAPGYVLSSKIRLARRGIRWEGAVHEMLDYAARRANYRVERSPIRVRHDGFFGKRSDAYYEGLCRKSYAEGTAHPGIVTTLGVIALSKGDLVDAERLLREAIASDPLSDRAPVWLGRLLARTNRTKAAIEVVTAALKRCAPSIDLIRALVELHTAAGEEASARIYADIAVKLFPDDPRARIII